jgi:rhamnulokinase
MDVSHLLAVDIGASGGRCILGTLDQGKLISEEISRFPNRMIPVRDGLHWDILALYEAVIEGLRSCQQHKGIRPQSLGIATWGVDFGLLAADGSILGFPRAYRDQRNLEAMPSFLERFPEQRLYQLTGIQRIFFNTVFQLWAMAQEKSSLLACAADLLFTPDLLNYLLCGEKRAEYTIASTSQLLDASRRTWSLELLKALGVNANLMQELVVPGTILGPTAGTAFTQEGLAGIPVIATTSHDTASAVAAVPAEGSDWAYLSSGTWSLLGIEHNTPIINDTAQALNFTNEGGVGGSCRVLKNITGLWLLQECRRSWAQQRAYSHEELIEAARSHSSFEPLMDPDAPEFASPNDMIEAMQSHCRRTHQRPPETAAEISRAIFVSLALKYRVVLDQFRQLSPKPINRLHVVGGGVRNSLLCQFTANATQLPVYAGPVEATATGNMLVQAMALGQVASVAQLREVVRASTNIVQYEPADTTQWEQAYERFREIHGE